MYEAENAAAAAPQMCILNGQLHDEVGVRADCDVDNLEPTTHVPPQMCILDGRLDDKMGVGADGVA